MVLFYNFLLNFSIFFLFKIVNSTRTEFIVGIYNEECVFLKIVYNFFCKTQVSDSIFQFFCDILNKFKKV
jgi:hypothetical protein